MIVYNVKLWIELNQLNSVLGFLFSIFVGWLSGIIYIYQLYCLCVGLKFLFFNALNFCKSTFRELDIFKI